MITISPMLFYISVTDNNVWVIKKKKIFHFLIIFLYNFTSKTIIIF